MFEIVRRDGLARLGKFETRSGILETPALLPVVNPKINTVTPRELDDEFGFRAIITNSYIIKNNPPLKERAQAEGLHKMLDFPGVIMRRGRYGPLYADDAIEAGTNHAGA